MRRQVLTVSASGGLAHSGIFIPDIHQTPFNVGFGATIATTAVYTVQHTFDDLHVTTADNATWFDHEFVAATAAAMDGNYAFPVTGIRVEIGTANEGGVSVTFVQAGYPNT